MGAAPRAAPRRLVALALACVASALLAPPLSAQAPAARSQAAQAASDRVLVLTVFPFGTNASPEASYLGEGFSEALTTKLVGLKRVKIYERSQFDRLASELRLERNASGLFDAATLARAGSVVSIDYALLGSVTQAGGAVSCNVRLVHVNSGAVALAREFRGAYPAELFGLQDAAAMAVAEALSLRLGELELKRLSARPTEDQDAYGMYNRSLASADQAERAKLLESAVTRDPSFSMAWHLLADAYMAMGRPERAEAAYRRLTDLDPGDHRASYNLALLRLDAQDYDSARRLLEGCVELKPGDADALYHLGLSFEFSPSGERFGEGADLGSALAYYKAAMAADARHAESRIAGGTLCAIMAQAEPDPALRLATLRDAEACLSEYLSVQPGALDAAAIAMTLESIKAAVAEHEEYLKNSP
ncbi:MAG: tetratricopeptide repeat protein [Spirochaetes bacterium]|nr:tetratricopeptide repeat protein [Spirochaetota bacterium]